MILSMIEMANDVRCGRKTVMCTQKLGCPPRRRSFASRSCGCPPRRRSFASRSCVGHCFFGHGSPRGFGANGDCGIGRGGGRFGCELGTEAKAAVIKV
jgi:hypothetical protein